MLEVFAARTGTTIQFGPSVEDRTITTTAEIGSFEEFVRTLDENYSLAFERDGDAVRLASALVVSPEHAETSLAAQAQPASDSGELSGLSARSGSSGVRPEVAAALRATPADLGILSNVQKPLQEYRRRGGRPALIMANAVLDSRAKVEEGKDWPIPEALRARPTTRRHIVQFKGPVSNDLRAELEGIGLEVTHYVPHNAYAVHGSAEELEVLGQRENVLLVESYHPYLKMSPDILQYVTGVASESVARRAEMGTYHVMLFPSQDADEVLARYDANILRRQSSGNRPVLTIAADPRKIDAMILDDGILYIEPDLPFKAMSDLAGPLVRSAYFSNTTGLDGSGVIVGVTDSGADVTHPGFAIDPDLVTGLGTNTRVIAYEARGGGPTSDGIIGDTDGHGSHVSGTLLGNGGLSETASLVPGSGDGEGPYAPGTFAGIAPGASLVMIEDFNSFASEEQAQLAWEHGVRVSNNSWGSSLFSYSALSAVWDALVRDSDPAISGNQQISYFFAAGNEGGVRMIFWIPRIFSSGTCEITMSTPVLTMRSSAEHLWRPPWLPAPGPSFMNTSPRSSARRPSAPR